MKICTLAIGSDFCKHLSKGLESKSIYAKKHNYEYIQGGEEFWDRNRPIPWSKIPFLLNVLNNSKEGELIFLSDADVLITNLNITMEENVVKLLPEGKDLLLAIDACGNLNDGNILIRNTEWSRDFWKRVYEQTEYIYHIWWENAAVISLLEKNPSDLLKTEITNKHKLFNAYIQGLPNQPLWMPGDFLVHFAGVYKVENIEKYMNAILNGEVPRKNMFG